MKQFLFLIAFFLLTLSSCMEAGESTQYINGTEENLPPELKGLKIYRVVISSSELIYVGVLNGEVKSLETSGKHPKRTIMVDISPDKVVYETDSVILIKK